MYHILKNEEFNMKTKVILPCENSGNHLLLIAIKKASDECTVIGSGITIPK